MPTLEQLQKIDQLAQRINAKLDAIVVAAEVVNSAVDNLSPAAVPTQTEPCDLANDVGAGKQKIETASPS